MRGPRSLVAIGFVLAFSSLTSAQRAGVDAEADAALRKMGQTLAAAKSFTFDSHATTDQLLPSGQKVQVARNQMVAVRRPEKAAVDVAGDDDDLHFRYDGKRVVLQNDRTQSWGQADAPATIEATLDLLAERYGMALPLADLLFPDPYATLIERVRTGQYLGEGYVFDTKCDHLAFRQEAVDWQIWIERGDQALPRKIVITYKDSPGHPQYTAYLSNWNLSADLPDDRFVFTPTAGTKEVEFAPSKQGEPTTKPTAGGAGAKQ